MTTSLKVYFALIVVVALLAPLQLYLPMGTLALDLEEQPLPASKPVMALASFGIVLLVYGGLGLLGMLLTPVGASSMARSQIHSAVHLLPTVA